MRTKGEGAAAASGAIRDYQQQIAELQGELHALEADAQQVEQVLAAALSRAASILLPDASAQRLGQLAALLGDRTLPGRRVWYEQQRLGWSQRLAQIEATADYVARQILLDPTTGQLTRALQEAQQALAQWQQALARFDIEPLRWLECRRAAQSAASSGFTSFWKAVTFEGFRIERAQKRCCEALGYATYAAVEADYRQALGVVQAASEQLTLATARRDALLALVEEQRQLSSWVHHFEENLVLTLRLELAAALGRFELSSIRRNLGPHPAGKSVAQAHGLGKKLLYLAEMRSYLLREIEDRQRRVASIDRTRRLWAAKPYERLSGDKRRWLHTVPELKRQAAAKQVRWMRRMHLGVLGYEDWEAYDYYLLEAEDFLPYDAFGYGAEEPMPWEGFAREVLGDLGPYRQAHEMEKKDYSVFKELDRSYHEGSPDAEGGGKGAEDGQGQADMGAVAGVAVVAAVAAVAASEALDSAEGADLS